MAYGITGFGAYVPRMRIERGAIAAAHAWMNPSLKGVAKGVRAFCSWDEDVITMAVEAGRDCLAGGARAKIDAITLASTTFPYADLSNAVIVASALGLPPETRTANAAGSQRAGTTALIEALRIADGEALVIASEKPKTLPGGVAEMQAGAGAAAITTGREGVIAILLSATSQRAHFVDRFRSADQSVDYPWEERWVRDEGYGKQVPSAIKAALVSAGIALGDIHHLILPAPVRGVAATIARQMGFNGTIAGAFEAAVGYCGVAHGFLMLAETLASAKPGDRILMVGFGQGVDVLLFEATDLCGQPRASRGVAGTVADKFVTNDYLRMLSFYDQIALDWGMRGEKTNKPAITEQYREADQLDTFSAGTCHACGTVQFPVLAYCVNPACAAPSDQFVSTSLADEPATIFTVTSDWLSYHPAPPLAVGFVAFENKARLLMEIVDARPEQVESGTRLRMVFRIKERDKTRGFNRYFWKATPVAEAQDG